MPPFQTSVSGAALPLGVVGELAFEGPLRAIPAWLVTATAANNIVGRALTYVSGATSSFPANPNDPADPKPAVVQVGGTGVFAGILANPKVYATAAIDFEGAGLVIPNNTLIEAVTMGEIIVEATGTITPGMAVAFNQTTGVIEFLAPDAEPAATQTLIANAEVKLWKSTTPSLAVIKLSR